MGHIPFGRYQCFHFIKILKVEKVTQAVKYCNLQFYGCVVLLDWGTVGNAKEPLPTIHGAELQHPMLRLIERDREHL